MSREINIIYNTQAPHILIKIPVDEHLTYIIYFDLNTDNPEFSIIPLLPPLNGSTETPIYKLVNKDHSSLQQPSRQKNIFL